MYSNMHEKDLLDDFPLPPPPSSQQVIDLRSGVVLHSSNASKPARYMGCSAHVLLILILLGKSALFSAWLWREYENFGYGCSFLVQGLNDISGSTAENQRVKRSSDIVELLDPRRQSFKSKNKDKPHSTVVTMTNTQVLPLVGVESPMKIKTIRQRMESIQPLPPDDEDLDSYELDDDESAEDPIVYISPIVNRHSGLPDPLKKQRKGKGKGKKGKTTTTTEAPVTKPPKKERGGRKKNKKNKKENVTDQTKAPRHLFTVDTSSATTMSSVLNEKTSTPLNQGHIRSFKMQKANQKPKKVKAPSDDGIKLSKETRLMWEMDELNFTTFATSSLRSTSDNIFIIEEDADDANDGRQAVAGTTVQEVFYKPTPAISTSYRVDAPNNIVSQTIYHSVDTTQAPQKQIPTRNDGRDDLEVVYVEKINKHDRKKVSEPVTTPQPVAIYYETIKSGQQPSSPIWVSTTQRESQFRNDVHSYITSTMMPTTNTKKMRPVKHGFDRSQDKAIDEGLMDFPSATAKPRIVEEANSISFQDQLSSFTTSAVCVARALFNMWCLCQLLTAFPFCIGICMARRALFVAHLVLDILFLVIGFIFSITTIVFSVILYVLVEEMRRSTLFYWLLFAVIVDVVLVAYSGSVIVSMRCCERIVQRRKNARLSSNGQSV